MTIQQFKPMLAVQLKGNLLHDDYVISPKYDGIRCIIRDGFPVSRNLKVIPNKFIQLAIGDYSLEGFDGELIVGSPTAPDVFNTSTRGIMSEDGEPDFKFYVFDVVPDDLNTPFEERHWALLNRVEHLDPEFRQHVVIVPQISVDSQVHMVELEEQFLAKGFEGAMVRRLSSPYKCGRSTEKQGWLMKLKRMATSEARVIGFECLYSNQNEAKVDALGHTERSSHKENMVPQDTLGKLIAKDLETGVEFSIGTGFTAAQRKELWDDQDSLIGKICSYNHFPIGALLAPRFPVWKGWRDPRDMS